MNVTEMGEDIDGWSRDQLVERCEVIEDGIIVLREVPGGKQGPFSTMVEICNELGRPFGEWVVIIDLADATRPTPKLIESMPRLFRNGAKRYIVHLHTTNKIMVGVGNFVMRRFSDLPLTLRNTRDDCVQVARRALRNEPLD